MLLDARQARFGLYEDDDPAAKSIADAIRVLYRIEHEADRAIAGARATGEAAIALRHQFRRDRAGPQLIAIRRLLDEAQPRYTVGSEMRKAIDYVLDRWAAFTAYNERGDLPIDNNAAERTIRPIVIGRKNWMLIGSEDAAPHAADLYTIFESCRLSKVEPRAYLAHVIAALHAGGVDPTNLTQAASMPFQLRQEHAAGGAGMLLVGNGPLGRIAMKRATSPAAVSTDASPNGAPEHRP